jgi:hypothetical protein
MIGDAGQDIGESCLGIDIVHFRGDDEAMYGGGTLPATSGRSSHQ